MNGLALPGFQNLDIYKAWRDLDAWMSQSTRASEPLLFIIKMMVWEALRSSRRQKATRASKPIHIIIKSMLRESSPLVQS